MSLDQILNVAFGIIAFLIGWLMKILWSSQKELQAQNEVLRKEFANHFSNHHENISNLKLKIASEYMSKADFQPVLNAIFEKIEKISDKFDKLKEELLKELLKDKA